MKINSHSVPALIKLYSLIPADIANIKEHHDTGSLTENIARNGRLVFLYSDGVTEAAVYLDDLKPLTTSEIAQELVETDE